MDDSQGEVESPPHHPHRFEHPSGRHVHIANNPGHAETLRRELTNFHGEGSFDLYIRGTDEHMNALREAQSHQEERRAQLREAHPHVWTDFEKVHSELDNLSKELNGLTNMGVALDANFGRFGYSAHIKTISDDAESTSGLSKTLSTQSENHGERSLGDPIKLWKRPVVRQYFHKGFIWRASENAEVSAMELFVDLIFVGLIAVMGDAAAEDPTGEALLRFCVTLTMAYQMWNMVTSINAWFVSNDLVQRLCIVFFTALLVGFTTNILNAFGSTYTELVSFYLTARLFNVGYFAVLCFLIPMLRFFLIFASIITLIPVALWIASIHVDYPNRLGLIFVALALDIYGYGVIVPMHRFAGRVQARWLKPLAERAEFYPAVNIEHRTERMNAFVTLVIGYSVVALLYQSNASEGANAYYGKAVLGLLIAIAFSLMYFEIDSTNIHVHAIRRSAVSWALAKLVIAHDCDNTPLDALADTFAEKSSEEIDIGLRWFFCGGIGVALACTAAISASHDHKDLPGLRFSKLNRLIVRSVCAIVIIVLPTAGDRLNSLDLLAVVTGILMVSLLVELWGCSDSERGSFWADKRCCNYAAECRLGKKDLEDLRNGEVSCIEELAKRRRQQKWEKEHSEMV